VHKIGPFSWRAIAFRGEFLSHDSALPLLSLIRGRGDVEINRLIPNDSVFGYLLAIRLMLLRQSEIRRPLDPNAMLSRFITIRIDKLKRVDGRSGDVLARLDIVVNKSVAHASLLSRNQPRVDLEPVRIEEDDGVWEVLMRFLAALDGDTKSSVSHDPARTNSSVNIGFNLGPAASKLSADAITAVNRACAVFYSASPEAMRSIRALTSTELGNIIKSGLRSALRKQAAAALDKTKKSP
jgi:hypothetical protein